MQVYPFHSSTTLMGVPGLWKILQPAAQTCSLTEVATVEGYAQDHRGSQTMVVGIDASFDIKKDGDTVMIFTETAIQTKQEVRLMQGGMLLMALLGGGDYNMVGLLVCGAVTTFKLLLTDIGDSLLHAAQQLLAQELAGFLISWCNELQNELSTDKSGFLGRCFPGLANSVHDNFPALCVIYQYTKPATSWSNGGDGPDINHIFLSSLHFVSALSPVIDNSFCKNVWDGCCVQHLAQITKHINEGVVDDDPPALSLFLQVKKMTVSLPSFKMYQVKIALHSLHIAKQSHLMRPHSVPLTAHGDVPKMVVSIPGPILESAFPMLILPLLVPSSQQAPRMDVGISAHSSGSQAHNKEPASEDSVPEQDDGGGH
ncbi:hypothetical protein L208DRAFT_1488673 [Tricholoma matsutake]|nr:hypothetical protein L208DRAFT_1488673 [Tricholoma matsutake 945]